MRRTVLVTMAALGGIICVIGGTGLFAALTDSARSGTNSIESAPLAASADIQLAHGFYNNMDGVESVLCGEFSEDLTTAFFVEQNVTPGAGSTTKYFCIRNVGSQPVSLSAMVDELSDVDMACTGDEELHGDSTCGGDGAGELAGAVKVRYEHLGMLGNDECDVVYSSGTDRTLADNATTPESLGTLSPGERRCFRVNWSYFPEGAAAEQQAQSDRVTWRFLWVGQA